MILRNAGVSELEYFSTQEKINKFTDSQAHKQKQKIILNGSAIIRSYLLFGLAGTREQHVPNWLLNPKPMQSGSQLIFLQGMLKAEGVWRPHELQVCNDQLITDSTCANSVFIYVFTQWVDALVP